MNVYSITMNKPSLAVTPLGDRYYKLAQDTDIMVHTDIGCLEMSIKAGFITNFRSGGRFVDGFVDQVGDEKKSLIYLIHDLFYTPCDDCNGEHPVTREFADEFLRDGLEWAGMGKLKRNVVYYSVRVFGKKAYEEDDHLTDTNRVLFTFKWSAKEAG